MCTIEVPVSVEEFVALRRRFTKSTRLHRVRVGRLIFIADPAALRKWERRALLDTPKLSWRTREVIYSVYAPRT